MSAAKVGVIVGGKTKGSNMAALAAAGRGPGCPFRVSLVIAPSTDAPAAHRAQELGIGVKVVEPGEGYGERLAAALTGIEVICLAGFLRLLPAEVLGRFRNEILNIHPALLPKFGGKGMYGMHVHRAVLDAGETESGCTVHYVTEVYDEGDILLQRRCPVLPDDTPESLAARVLALEHQVYPEALRLHLERERG